MLFLLLFHTLVVLDGLLHILLLHLCQLALHLQAGFLVLFELEFVLLVVSLAGFILRLHHRELILKCFFLD